ncbi:MAG: sensor histidine kinase [Maioricimonas sp. JB049]
MVLTRSIRRKLAVGLALLSLMMFTLSVSSIAGVTSYRRMVKDLELSIAKAPRRADLLAAIGTLLKPLAKEFPRPGKPDRMRHEAAAQQRRELDAALSQVRITVADFRRRLQQLPDYQNRRAQEEMLHRNLFKEIDDRLSYIAACGPALEDLDSHDATSRDLLGMTAELWDSVQHTPDPSVELIERLDQAERDYRMYLNLVVGTGLAALAIFFGLSLAAYRWVFCPIRELHQGARRVAHGDFDYRIPVTGQDEISELADAFNRMTERFHAVAADLDQQVQERSRQLVQSERLAGVGFLAAGVAHEINNPLAAIAMAAESLEFRLHEILPEADNDDAELVREYLGMMQTEAQRCRSITERLLDFARGNDSERNLYDVTAIVNEVIGMTKHVGRFRDRSILVNRTSPCYAYVNGPEIKQVILNLVANGLEASGTGGEVRVNIDELADKVDITVQDDGSGMTPDVIQHIFEPFYTTKDAGKGTGLGLSISHRIVCDHGGTLEASSHGPGRGSTFRLRLPTSAPTQKQAA